MCSLQTQQFTIGDGLRVSEADVGFICIHEARDLFLCAFWLACAKAGGDERFEHGGLIDSDRDASESFWLDDDTEHVEG